MKQIILITILIIFQWQISVEAKPNIEFEPSIADFGTVYKSDGVKKLKIIMINKSDNLYTINSYIFVNGDFLSSDLPEFFQLKPDEEKTFSISLNPAQAGIGEFQAKMMFKIDSTDKTILIVTGKIEEINQKPFQIALNLPEMTVRLGKEFELPVIISSIQYNRNKIDAVTGQLIYNASILAPANYDNDDKIEFGRRTTKFETAISNKDLAPGDTLFVFPMISALGDAVSSKIVLENVRFYYHGNEVATDLKVKNGTVYLEGIIYEDSVPRLISRISSVYRISPPPNPVENDFTLKITYIGKVYLKIYTINGAIIKDYSGELPEKTEKGSEEIFVPHNIFGSFGAYIIRLSAKDNFVSRMIIVK
jgi:hypothetical protein